MKGLAIGLLLGTVAFSVLAAVSPMFRPRLKSTVPTPRIDKPALVSPEGKHPSRADGNSPASDPVAVNDPSDDTGNAPPPNAITDKAKEAVKTSPNVRTKVIGSGAVMFLMPYGPCGILYRRPRDFFWHSDFEGDTMFPDLNSAIVAAEQDCEQYFQFEKEQRDAARREAEGWK